MDPHDVRRFGDDGCWLHDHCLTCPLPRCVFDVGTAQQLLQERVKARAVEIRRAVREERLSIQQAAERFGVSVRTVARALAKAKKEL